MPWGQSVSVGTWNTYTAYAAANAESAPPTPPGDVDVELIGLVRSHRDTSGWEAVRHTLQAIGILVLMFLLALLGITLGIALAMWVL